MIEFFVGGSPRYLDPNTLQVFTEDEYNEMVAVRVQHDFETGYKDRILGYYDKWYRYNRSDNGKAYDEGVEKATMEDKCSSECKIIECCESCLLNGDTNNG